MTTIHTTSGVPVFLDDEDLELVSKYSWLQQSAGYVFANPRIGGGKRLHIYMHRLIMRASLGECVDHIDHDPTNNTRGNLRLCDDTLNHGNMRLRSNNTSGYKGVRWNGFSFTSRVTFRGKTYSVGSFGTLTDAVVAYNNKAAELFGEFAYLNPIPKQ